MRGRCRHPPSPMAFRDSSATTVLMPDAFDKVLGTGRGSRRLRCRDFEASVKRVNKKAASEGEDKLAPLASELKAEAEALHLKLEPWTLVIEGNTKCQGELRKVYDGDHWVGMVLMFEPSAFRLSSAVPFASFLWSGPGSMDMWAC